MRLLLILGFLLLAYPAPPLRGQDDDRVQKLVVGLYPRNDRLIELRMGEIVRQMGIRNGSRVADVGCGPAEISIILASVVGVTGKVYCEDISADKQWGLPAAKRNIKKKKAKN